VKAQIYAALLLEEIRSVLRAAVQIGGGATGSFPEKRLEIAGA